MPANTPICAEQCAAQPALAPAGPDRLTARQRYALQVLVKPSSSLHYPANVGSATARSLQDKGLIHPNWYITPGNQLVAQPTENGVKRIGLKRGRKPRSPSARAGRRMLATSAQMSINDLDTPQLELF